MTRLTQANKVIDTVGLFMGSELAVRPGMMHRDRVAQMYAAILTSTAVTLYRLPTSTEPRSTAIGFRSTDPARRFISLENCGGSEAFPRAKTRGSVLTHEPGFATKGITAVLALENHIIDPSRVRTTLNLIGREGVGRPDACTEFVTREVGSAHDTNRHMPFPTATVGAKAGTISAVIINLKLRSTDLTSLCNHAYSIPKNLPFMGSGTTGIGASLGGFDFVGIEREVDYFRIAEMRNGLWREYEDEPNATPDTQGSLFTEAA